MKRSLAKQLATEDIAGLDIADHYMAVTRVVLEPGGPVVRNAGWCALEPGLPDDQVVSALRDLWRRCRIPTYTVCSAARSRSLVLKHFCHPCSQDQDLAASLEEVARDLLHVPPEMLYMDWLVNAVSENGHKTAEGVLVAAPRVDVDDHMNLLRRAGLYPVAMDAAALSAAHLYARLRPLPPRGAATCLVNMSGHTADMAILSEGPKVYPRVALSLQSSWDEATAYLAENIVEVTEHYHRKLRKEPVTRVVFTGHLPNWEAMANVLAAALPVPVECWNPALDLQAAGRTRLDDPDPATLAPLLTTSLGLAFRKGQRD